MTETEELTELIVVLRGQGVAVGVDDVARLASVLHHTRAWPRERRLRALKTLLGRSPAERQRFDHIAPLLFSAGASTDAAVVGAPDAAEAPADPAVRRPRWRLLAIAVVVIAAPIVSLSTARLIATHKVAIDATNSSARTAPDPGNLGSGQQQADPDSQQVPGGGDQQQSDAGAQQISVDGDQHRPDPGFRQITHLEPSSLPKTLRSLAEGCWIASLLLATWSIAAWRAQRRRDAAIDRLVRSTGRRMVRVDVERPSLQPIDRQTITDLAHMLAAPVVMEPWVTLDPDQTVEQTVRNAGLLTLCFGREREQPTLILLEDVSQSMQRWPAHAAQLARALEAQGQPVDRRFISGDPLHTSEDQSLDARSTRLEDLRSDARIVVVSDAAYFDRGAARTVDHARALAGAVWLSPRPRELWQAGARWVNTRTLAWTLGAIPSSLASPTDLPPPWHPPQPRADVHETADAWRAALGADAYLALAATALLDLAISWSAIHVWALISDGVIVPSLREFERIWDLPELMVSQGGRISVASDLRDRLLADARSERPEMLQRVGCWIDARLNAAIKSAGDSSLGAAVGEVYRDRVARAAGIDGSGERIQQLVQSGLVSVVAAHTSESERKLWRVRDPRTAVMTRLRGPLLSLALTGATGFTMVSELAPPRHEVTLSVPIDAGLSDASDASTDSTDLDSNQDRDATVASDASLAMTGASDAGSATAPARRRTQRRVPVDAPGVAPVDAEELVVIDANEAVAIDAPGIAMIDAGLDPDGDDDHDGIPNKDDKCPNDPEDFDGFEDQDGCPDPDNDHDGIPDKDDKCPNEPETYNGYQDEDGCPDRGRVVVTDTTIEIFDVIYFEYDKDVIQSRSFPILDAVAATMQGNPSIQLIEIQGHTDERGDDAYNLDLSDRRAKAVMAYLVNKGVEAKRLTAQGYGETQPLDRRHNEAAWRKNRRVTFLIIKRATD
jgi:outer membrane protein OmpA-like peptidoglycan-associated protein/uncharacterized protein with von Willebrand factor type A (vWA) domain